MAEGRGPGQGAGEVAAHRPRAPPIAGGAQLWKPGFAYFSGGLNVLLGLVCFGFALANPEPGPNAASQLAAARRYERSVVWIFCFTLAFCVTHLWLAGSHNSVVVLTLLTHLLLVRWFAPPRAVHPLLTLSFVATALLVVAEYLRWVPYSPMVWNSALSSSPPATAPAAPWRASESRRASTPMPRRFKATPR